MFFFCQAFFFKKKKKTHKILINYLGALTICSQASAGLIIQADHQTCSLNFFFLLESGFIWLPILDHAGNPQSPTQWYACLSLSVCVRVCQACIVSPVQLYQGQLGADKESPFPRSIWSKDLLYSKSFIFFMVVLEVPAFSACSKTSIFNNN